ncbi:type I-F CRISPR-associated helicase Cas3 [Shewanella sp. SNU WT4]|uniref:type I-F CRISPR-associated helicase Cas3f n=1 Tax=Shewanella sp. SNU WT4 TaxID=2590015 RepID=UPI0011264647|nr:type I-F CRISPR-associated helicase Cas3f [Shewanella sp. SNU WT4]QDF67377.1 type I-F CRISPR-associated helicase Cas3 [Shewanella sp. SNU WT4]
MMVTFVSQCEKNALKKTRRVLDAFANRIGDNTWQTLITEEGLLTVKKMLRQTASRSTAVSCHWIRSRSRSQFLWVVGNNKKFNSEGYVPVNSTSADLNPKQHFYLNTNVIALLAQLAGFFHDVGKAIALFQQKLISCSQGIAYEPYRHEWVSLRIFQAFVNEDSDQAWLARLADINHSTESFVLENLNGLRDGIAKNPKNPFEYLPPLAKLVAWLIVSHHKLPQYPKGGDNPPVFENSQLWLSKLFEACWNSPQCLNTDWSKANIEENWSFPYGTPFKSAQWQTQVSIVAKEILKEDRCFTGWFNQHFTMHLSRLSLMLADHYYSSLKDTTPEWQDRNYHAYANTDKDENGQKYRKQKLDEHNIAVGHHAKRIAKVLPQLRDDLPALIRNKELSRKVPKEYKDSFGWQDDAYELSKSLHEDSKKYGFFGVSMASTGKGKTRANARIMYGVSGETNCRFSIALGLRTLTLQTGDSLEKDLKLNKDELAVLIGSQVVKDLHQQSRQPEMSIEESYGSGSAEPLLKDEVALKENLPEYTGVLAKWLKHDPKMLKLIQAPVLVSTIDYLMPATEGVRGGRQIAPMLRLLSSDLVLDEPDDFGLEDLPALCRLVNWAGMLGSRVLLSTATISPALAKSLFTAYQAGRKHYTQVNGEQGETTEICCAWFDEFNKPSSAIISDVKAYQETHNKFVEKRIKNLTTKTKPLRKSAIIPMQPILELLPSQLMAKQIRQSIIALHEQHSVKVESKNVSIGLVRLANISPLVAIAKWLFAQDAPSDYVIHYCVYHSQFPLLQRSKIEKQLDKALTRHDEADWLNNSGFKELVETSVENNHIFVVLATAVAEVGRDHDYDWAVVEPSSMRSIIQLAGRVQRHRQSIPATENIHILSKNYKGLKGKSPCFEKPGFEAKPLLYAHRDLLELNCETELKQVTAISRIKTLTSSPHFEKPKQTGDKPKFLVFNELEHFSQSLRLEGSANEQNCAAQWWKNEATWCGEIQRIQPFRKSEPTADYKITFNRSGKPVWQKKVPKSSPAEFLNTDDFAKQPEEMNMAVGNRVWGNFDLKEEIRLLSERLSMVESTVLEKFTHLSLRILNADNGDQWQCHPVLGVYQNLKGDEYGVE